ncbi:YafY family protein [Achromobacter sp. NFACC18-2]|uniref:helix-turn-helix transcriptional regulator n=1 Tax=Achromobacter sp. NFACC18-2 TaxID=1564112 RepID=UPI0008BD20C6|nr:WYL domain-containing protein [Achromobacter sp. NFACC18-2]SEK12582.1 Predicted DNA-binding transcriptional regulator YafY, contains an HTH and WYL domains [Achromobacter sp. NFACC18-2]
MSDRSFDRRKLTQLHSDILTLLSSSDHWINSQSLHAKLRPRYGQTDATSKTIQRALRHLLDIGLIEASGRGSARELRKVPNSAQNKAEIQSVELAVALLQLEQFATNQLPEDALKSLRDHCDRSRELLNSHPTYPRYLQGRAWSGKAALIDSGYPLIPPPQNEAMLRTILDALYRGRQLSIQYQNAAIATAKVQRYEVTPLALVERGSALYLLSCRRSGRTGLYKQYMQRLDRMLSAVITENSADPDPSFELERFLKHEHTLLFFPEAPQSITLRVRERGSRSRLRQYRLSEDQVIHERDYGFELKATVRPSLTFKQFVIGLAPDVILTAPASLRRELQTILTESAEAYAEGTFQT